MVFTADPAAAVVVGWSDLGHRFRLVANEVDVVAPLEDLPKLPVARAVWKPRPDWRTSTECWLAAGGPHHTVLSTQVSTDEVREVAGMVETELSVVDGSTTVREFNDRLRYEEAYFRSR
jgi:L-arabinose isomerase